VVKTHTCWNVPVYREPLDGETVQRLLERHYRPYHARLRELAAGPVRLGVDCHTMAAVGPPIGPLAGRERPPICLGNADGTTCPPGWMERLARCLGAAAGVEVTLNFPFRGGYITRTHAAELPWIQLELSRGPFLPPAGKRRAVLDGLRRFCDELEVPREER